MQGEGWKSLDCRFCPYTDLSKVWVLGKSMGSETLEDTIFPDLQFGNRTTEIMTIKHFFQQNSLLLKEFHLATLSWRLSEHLRIPVTHRCGIHATNRLSRERRRVLDLLMCIDKAQGRQNV